MNLNQQLIDLHEIEVNTIKKEKNFDFRTALIQLFKSLYALLRGKQNISKADLANASEKESKRLGLEGRYDWNEIFGLEKEVIENAGKQGNKEQKLNKPDNFYVGQAIADGNCFFDSFRQGLEQQTGVQVTVEQYRLAQEQKDSLLARQLQEREDYSLAMKLQEQEQKDSLLAREVQEQEDLLCAKQLQDREFSLARQLQEREYVQSFSQRCSMEEVKIEDQHNKYP